MFPITVDVVDAERSRRLEGYAAWSRRRRDTGDPDAEDTGRPPRWWRAAPRPALGR